ncbi:MAG: diaminopimelate epimerase [Verrucomicrobiota bacterium]
MRLFKYHALGNDYFVLDAAEHALPSPEAIAQVCHRHYGLGSDGILYGPLATDAADFGLRILNPDGSEAEKSGNGLRIFCRYLLDEGKVGDAPFTIETPGGVVTCRILDGAHAIEVEMGRVSFRSSAIGMSGDDREVINETVTLEGSPYTYCAATIGNPHCVVPLPEISEALARRLGPLLETAPRFLKRTNVQFLKILDRSNIQIEIWERGAGYTLASGSSSSAAGAVAKRLGLVDGDLTVHMPGGQIRLLIDDAYNVRMTGPASRIGTVSWQPDEA